MPSAKEILQDLTGKQYIYLLGKGSIAIKEALGYVKEYTIILADQGGWLTYDVYAEKSNIVATDNGLVDPTTLEDYDDSYVLMVNSMAGYAFPQDMKELSKGRYMVINDATGSIGTENAKYGKYIIGSFGKAKPVNLGTGAFLASDEALNIQEDFDFDQEEKLTKLLKELPTRIKKLKTITKKVKKDLKHLNIIHPEKDGINVIIAYEQEKEKEEIINYCKENKYPFSECPRVIRVTQQAICVEVKRNTMKLSHINLRDLQDTEYQLIKNKLSAWPVFATDIIILHEERGKKGIVIIERGNEPYGLALPGGFVELGLTTEQNAIKEAKEETNLNIKILNANHPYVFSDPKRDPRGNIIGLIYIANSKGGRIKAGDDAKHTHLMNKEELQKAIKTKKFAVDHGKILTYLLKKEALL